MKPVDTSSPRHQAGRSIVELMVALTIGLVILGALLLVHLSSSTSSRQAQTVERMNEDGAIALHFIASQIRLAGFSYPRLNAPPVSATVDGAQLQVADRYFVGAGIRGCDKGFVDATVAFAALQCATGGSGSSAFVVRYEGDANNTMPTAAGAATDCGGSAVPVTAVAATDGTRFALVDSRFSSRISTGIGIPELACGGNGNAFSSMPLVQLVESLSLRYGLAEDGVAWSNVRFVDAATVDGLGGSVDANWSRVISVQVCVLVRSEERDTAGGGNYIGCSGQAMTAADGYTRRAYRTVVALRNRSGFAQGAT